MLRTGVNESLRAEQREPVLLLPQRGCLASTHPPGRVLKNFSLRKWTSHEKTLLCPFTAILTKQLGLYKQLSVPRS